MDAHLGALLLWATVTGLDLASLLQGLLNRPLVAAAVAGAILGDLEAGLRVGVVLELFALDVLPIGASRYPDYGAASVAAVAFAAGQPWAVALGPAVLLGLLVAHLGSFSVIAHRRVTAVALRRHAEALDRGDPGVATRVHLVGLAADGVRSLLLAVLGLAAAAAARTLPSPDPATSRTLALVAISGGFVAVIGGALRRAGTPRRIAWVVGGAVLGIVAVVWQ